jgi:uncharacterized DUF497 family protein
MEYEWDDNKAAANSKDKSVSFEAVFDLDWDEVLELEDTREDYGETRMIAYGPIKGRLHCLVYTRRGSVCRVISLRKTNKKEVENYEQAKAD